MSDEPVVKVTLADIYKQGQETKNKVVALEHKVDSMTAIHERLKSHKDDITEHSKRLGKLETNVARISVIVGLITTAIGALLVKFFTS